ncbi:MAG TPA: hypothetical protein VFN67_22495 [Polyangiales bacterium]|jgi:hypothetical protein|nr:hypothetical protein [Polyangiales bacterium]
MSAQLILERLSAEDSPARSELVTQLVQHVLSQRLRDVIAPEALLPIVLDTLTRENLAREWQRSVQPGVQRYSARVAAASETLSELMPDDAVALLRAQLGEPTGARARWAKGAVDPALLKRLLAPVWVQLLVNFAKRIPGLGGSGAGGSGSSGRGSIASMLGRGVQQGAASLVGAGRNALEGLGIDVEKKLTAAARDFSDGALSVWNQAMRERMQSPEGKAIVTQIKHGVLEHVLKVKLSDLDRDAVALPLAAYLDLVPLVLGHAVRVPFVRNIIDAELRAYLDVAGDKRLDEVLTELGVLEQTRAYLIARANTQLAGFSQSPVFAAWITKLVDAT